MNYDGLIPVPPHLWHLTILSPFFRVPFPSQFLQGFFFCPALFRTVSSQFNHSNLRRSIMLCPFVLGIAPYKPRIDKSAQLSLL